MGNIKIVERDGKKFLVEEGSWFGDSDLGELHESGFFSSHDYETRNICGKNFKVSEHEYPLFGGTERFDVESSSGSSATLKEDRWSGEFKGEVEEPDYNDVVPGDDSKSYSRGGSGNHIPVRQRELEPKAVQIRPVPKAIPETVDAKPPSKGISFWKVIGVGLAVLFVGGLIAAAGSNAKEKK